MSIPALIAELRTAIQTQRSTTDLLNITAQLLEIVEQDNTNGITTDDDRLSGVYIPDPVAAINADFDALDIVDPVTEVAPTATRNFDPRTAETSMAFTLWKSSTGAFGIVIDVTTGGNQGWTTDGGLDTNFTVPNSAAAAAGQWLIRIDLPNKRISCIPAT